jgi:hypothetical protein
MEILRVIFMAHNFLSSLAMGIYMHIVFRAPFPLGIFDNIPMFTPSIVNFAFAINWVALPMGLYLLSQTLAMVLRPPGSIALAFIPIAQIVVATFNTSDMTIFQAGAWRAWLPFEIVDGLYFAVGARLLQRSWYGEVDRGGHHGF